ncbi:hypothetical protein BH11ACT2_BH11ACT2_05190 [soil metagenome]
MPTISITRTFAAPPDRVFDAWLDPEQFATWFGGSAGEIPLETVRIDPTVGGTWAATMFAGPDRFEINWKGRYLALDRPSHLAFTLTDVEEEGEPTTVDLTATADGGTSMAFRQTSPHMTDEQGEQTAAGWGTFFDALAAIVEA